MVRESKNIYLNAVILTLICTAYFTCNYLLEWPILAGKFLGIKPIFVDLQQTLKQVACVETTLNRSISFSQSAVDCGFVYSRPLYEFILILDLQPQDVLWLGLVLGLLLIWSLVVIAHIGSMTLSGRRTLLATLLICSPPIMLLFERANIDALIFLLLVAACFSVYKGYRFFALIVLLICTLMKFYTLATVWIVWALMKKWKRITLLAPLLSISVYVLLDLLRTASNSPYPTAAAFGNAILGKYLQSGPTNRLIDLILGLLAVAVCWVILRRVFVTNLSRLAMSFSNVSPRLDESLFWLSSAVFICCYFATSNWDYRLVFLLGQILVLWPKILNASSQRGVIIFRALFVATFWLSFNAGRAQVFGDVAIGVIVVLTLMLWKENWRTGFEVWRERT